ncbi:MAG: hypothetical protein JNK63_03035 [Chthonomonas sp.]|nr:hypothetical protein [Chthonomonas sp.]
MRGLLPILVLATAVGCAPPPASAPEKPLTTNQPATDAPKPAPTEVAAALQHDGYIYGGFSKPGTQNFVVKISGQEDGEGSQTTVLKSSESGLVTYERSRDGVLAPVGSDVVKLDSKGVTVVSVSVGKLKAPSLELPANLAAGQTWTATSSIDTGSATIKNAGTYRVVGDAPIKVAAGSFTARKVLFSGTIETSQGRGKLSGTYWFVKDLGAVKTEMITTLDGQKPQTFILELKK